MTIDVRRAKGGGSDTLVVSSADRDPLGKMGFQGGTVLW
jgi:hypothetical protein